jgi:mRNA-degrading endonuclease YafQ of YafQ-DinJ toxin-antitoxin module
LKNDLLLSLSLLEDDAFAQMLRTHKLTGILKGSWACSAGYDVRIIFSFVKQCGKECILLETIGSHDEVY